MFLFFRTSSIYYQPVISSFVKSDFSEFYEVFNELMFTERKG